MAKEKRGYVFKDKYNRWFARTSYRDETGKHHNLKKAARSHAKEALEYLLRELDDHGGKSVESARMTFGELADFYEKTYLIEAQYVGDRKVTGLRSGYDAKLRLKTLRDYFGKRRLREITHADLEKLRLARLGKPTKHGKQRSIATVNRELGLMRRVLNVALANGWIHKSPFTMGKSLISVGDEKPRERILTREEEERMLAACVGWRAHLRPIIICALDTGMRRGELFKLRWADVGFDNKLITIRAFNTKTMRERRIGITERLAGELAFLYAKNPNPDALLFGIGSLKGSWNKVCRQARVTDLRFHDLRHTYATRPVSKHLPLSAVGRVLGHIQPTTTYRYTNLTVETARRAAEALNELHGSGIESTDSRPAMINWPTHPRLYPKGRGLGPLEEMEFIYDPEAVFLNQAGEVKKGVDELRQELAPLAAVQTSFDYNIKQVIQTGDIALMHTEWKVSSRPPMAVYAIEVAHRQPDGTWRWLIGDPFTVGRQAAS